MKILGCLLLLIGFTAVSQSQTATSGFFPKHLSNTQIATLQKGDSLVYYQCHVDSAKQEITLSNGHKITSKKKRFTITEKFVIHRTDSIYKCHYFTSSVVNYPNKKFPYLTLKEVPDWGFELKADRQLNMEEVLLIAALETKTHLIIHYELNINKTCPNQLIVKGKTINEQFIIEGNYTLSSYLKLL